MKANQIDNLIPELIIPRGHSGRITDCVFNSQVIVTKDELGIINVWNTQGQLLRSIDLKNILGNSFKSHISLGRLSPDGLKLIIHGSGNLGLILNLDSGKISYQNKFKEEENAIELHEYDLFFTNQNSKIIGKHLYYGRFDFLDIKTNDKKVLFEYDKDEQEYSKSFYDDSQDPFHKGSYEYYPHSNVFLSIDFFDLEISIIPLNQKSLELGELRKYKVESEVELYHPDRNRIILSPNCDKLIFYRCKKDEKRLLAFQLYIISLLEGKAIVKELKFDFDFNSNLEKDKYDNKFDFNSSDEPRIIFSTDNSKIHAILFSYQKIYSWDSNTLLPLKVLDLGMTIHMFRYDPNNLNYQVFEHSSLIIIPNFKDSLGPDFFILDANMNIDRLSEGEKAGLELGYSNNELEYIIDHKISADGRQLVVNSVFEKEGWRAHSIHVKVLDLDFETSISNFTDNYIRLGDLPGSIIDVSQDGRYVTFVIFEEDYGAKFCIWNTVKKKMSKFKFHKYRGYYKTVIRAISPDRELFALVFPMDDGELKSNIVLFHNVEKESPLSANYKIYNLKHEIKRIIFTKDGKKLLAQDINGDVIFWDTNSLKKSNIQTPEYSSDPSGKELFSASLYSVPQLGAKEDSLTMEDIEDFYNENYAYPILRINHEVSIFTRKRQTFALTSFGGKDIHIWNCNKKEVIGTINLIGKDDWIVTTPSGVFDASPGARTKIYYTLGFEIISFEQLKERYWQPELLQILLNQVEGEIKEVKEFKDVPLFPTILSAEIIKGKLVVKIKERSGGIGRTSLRINHKERATNINKKGQTEFSVSLKKYYRYFSTGKNTISIRCWNKEGWLPGPLYELEHNKRAYRKRDNNEESALHTIFVGTSKYINKDLNLDFADQDATYLNDAMTIVGKLLFKERVYPNLLTTEHPGAETFSNKENIQKTFNKVAKIANPQDVVIIYFSGHGSNYDDGNKAQYYYLTHDAINSNLNDRSVREMVSISSEELTSWVNNISARKQVLIFDTCYSGKIVDSLKKKNAAIDATRKRAMERMKDRTGTFVLTGSAADKVSYETSNYGQGLLTYSLLQGMKGPGLMDTINQVEKSVDVLELFVHSKKEVVRLSKEFSVVQHPQLSIPKNVDSFEIGIVTQEAKEKIKLAMPKPVFERSNFMNSENFLDDLDISETLDQYLSGTIGIGNRPEAIFIDAVNFPGAHHVRGLYSKTTDSYTIKGKVYKNQTSLGDFEVKGEGMEDLVPKIGRHVEQIVFPDDEYEIPDDPDVIEALEKGRAEELVALIGKEEFGYKENFIGESFKVPLPQLRTKKQKRDIARLIKT